MTVKLVPRPISHDTIETFSEAARDSKDGKIIGSILGVMYDDLTVRIGSTGEFYNNPLFARSIAAELDDYLSEQTKGVL